MRTSNIVQKSQSSREVGENAIAMSIDEASSVFLMDALGKLYSRPAQAVLREYLSNAVDAHKAKGGKLPAIQITLPEGKTSKLFIRDFGKGMNEEEFGAILSRYGASTKRDSNAMIGGFGLGAKSGFALSDEFFMTSYQQGRGIRVRIFKDALNQGFIDVVDRFSTKEPDGMLVEITIPAGNLYELSKKSLFVDFPFFMGYGVDAIDVRSTADFASQMVHNDKAFKALSFGGESVGWLSNKFSAQPKTFALIGRVAYPLDLSMFASLSKQNKAVDTALVDAVATLKAFKKTKVINIPIGSVDLPSSREEIIYSERSIRTIGAILSNYERLMQQEIQRELNSKSKKLQALEYFADLEGNGYKKVSELSWKGSTFNIDSFGKSASLFTTLRSKAPYGYGSTIETTTDHTQGRTIKTFRELNNYSNKAEFKQGIYRITVDSASDVATVKKLLTPAILSDFLNIDENDPMWRSSNAVFIVSPKDDVFSDWVFNYTDLDVAELRKIVEKKQAEKAAKAKKAEAERVKRQKAQERAAEAKKLRSQEMLSNFSINSGNSETLSRNKVSIVFKDPKIKKVYWSEEEVETYASVTKTGKDDLINGKVLFPFTPNEEANSFEVIMERDGWNRTNYLAKLRTFLKLFFGEGTKVIVLGKERNLEEFKTEHPTVESGVLFVKKMLEEQIAKEHSDILVSYNAIKERSYSNNIAIRNMLELDAALKGKRVKLNPELSSAIERLTLVRSSSQNFDTTSGLDEVYFMVVLKKFIPVAVIKKNNYSVNDEIAALKKKYPLLVSGRFEEFTSDVINDIVAYMKLCESR